MEDLNLLHEHPLFSNMNHGEIRQILDCFSFYCKTYPKDSFILMEGDPITHIGIILEGSLLMEKYDRFGNNCFLTELGAGELFADTFVGITAQKSSVNYKALADCRILMFPNKYIWKNCSQNCSCHITFIGNLMALLAFKTRSLLIKIEILSKRSLRSRIYTFLNALQDNPDIFGHPVADQSARALSSNQILLPFNYTKLAEYLGVNRSALIREFSRMETECLITRRKDVIAILPSHMCH